MGNLQRIYRYTVDSVWIVHHPVTSGIFMEEPLVEQLEIHENPHCPAQTHL